MSIYREAIAGSISAQKSERIHQKTIPEALLTIHPKVLYQEMPQMLADCQFLQEQVLSEILFLAQDSAYALDHGFAGIGDLTSWKAQTAISTYEDYRPYIDAHMAHEGNGLFSGETAFYIATTGSTGQVKYFVESVAGNEAKQLVMAMRGMYMSDLLPVTLDMAAKNLTISNYASLGTSPSGKLIVRASGQTARNMRKKTGPMNILPLEFWEAPSISPEDRDYMIGVYALANHSLAKVFCNNLVHFGRILDLIEAQGQQMIEDIRVGQFMVDLQPKARLILAPTLPPNPERADFLQEIFGRYPSLEMNPFTIAEIWPDLAMTGCWLSAGVGRDAKMVLSRLPNSVKAIDLGYGASEGKFNIPTRLNCPAGVAAPFACFYEFLPLDGGSALNLWEVQEGCHYELVITTYSGLYRYNLQDIVKIDGFIGRTPSIEFCGKSSEVLWIDQQKIYGFVLADLIRNVEKAMGLCLGLVQVFMADEKLCYVLMKGDKDFDGLEMKLQLDLATKACFGWCSGALYLMDPSYKDQLFTDATRIDRGACGIKLPLILKQAPRNHILTVIK